MKQGLVLAAAMLAGGCVADTAPSGQVYFAAQCARCHGTQARGDGLLAGDLPVAPPDLTLLADRNGGTFPEEAVMAQIYGYPGRFHRGVMPEFGPEMGDQTVAYRTPDGTVIDTPPTLIALTDWLESIQR